jgi:dTDP-4-dehydrorhamnose reductase
MLNLIVVGANGQVGRELVALAISQNISVKSYGHSELDISNYQAMETCLAPVITPNTIIINAAAYTAVDLAEDDSAQAYAVNAKGVEYLAKICKLHQRPLIHISTDYVFSGEKDNVYVEDDTTGPLGVYGETKLAGEELLCSILPEHVILRVSWVFGQYGKNFVKTILRLAKEREQLKIVDDQVGNPTAAADIARVILLIATQIEQANKDSRIWGIYHYCNKPSVSWYEFACAIVDIARQSQELAVKKIEPITSAQFPTKAKRPMNSRLNCDKIRTVFGIEQNQWHPYLSDVIREVSKNV